jgi:hypothetical protein
MLQLQGVQMSKKYEPKIGLEVDVREQHQRRIELFTVMFGAVLVLLVFAVIALELHVSSRGETWLSAILAFGLASASVGIAGALSVEFRHSGLAAKGTLGFGIFVLVFLGSALINGHC